MKLTVQVKLMHTREQESIIKETLVGYIRTVNDLVAEFILLGELKNKTSADVQGSLPSALKAQAIQDARSVFQKYRKELFKAKNLHTYSFYRLVQFVRYKAALAGFAVIFVIPRYTSQICHRKCKCPCGFKTHRDILGAMNITNALLADAHGLSA